MTLQERGSKNKSELVSRAVTTLMSIQNAETYSNI